MKILHVAPIGNLKQGIGAVLSNLVPLQIVKGCDVKIVSPRENKAYPELNVLWISNKREFEKLIEDWAPDIVQFHSVYWAEYIGFYKALLCKGIPYVVQLHGALSEANYKKHKWKKWIANTLFFNEYLKNAKTIIYLSKREQEVSIVPKINKVASVLPNGCAAPIYPVSDRIPSSPIDLVYIGRLAIEHKGLDLMMLAINEVKKMRDIDCHFSFYGNLQDSDAERFLSMLKPFKGFADFYGGIYGEEKYKRLHESDIFIQTSRFEGLPMGVLEALSYGVPCILTPGTNLAEIVKESGAGWETAFDYKQMSLIIRKAIKDYITNYKTMRDNAVRLSRKYNWDYIAIKSIELYKKLI